MTVNANLAKAKARAILRVAHCPFFRYEHGLNARAFIHLPAISQWSNFDDCRRLILHCSRATCSSEHSLITKRPLSHSDHPRQKGRFTGDRQSASARDLWAASWSY